MNSIKTVCAAVVCLSTLCAGAVNMLVSGNVETKDVPDEFRFSKGAWMADLSVFEEDATWNHCLQMKLVKIHEYPDGKHSVGVWLDIGGTEKTPGFSVTSGTKYRFSFEARGEMPEIGVCAYVWDKTGKGANVATTLKTVTVGKDWAQYRGTFVAPTDAERAVLRLKLYADDKKYPTVPFTYKVGNVIYLDNLSIEPFKTGRDIWPARALVVPDAPGGKAVAGDFSAFSSARALAKQQSKLFVKADDRGLRVGVDMQGAPIKIVKKEVWLSDSAELLLRRMDDKNDPVHLVIAADGTRWMDGLNPDYASWTATAKQTSTDSWRAEFSVPWKTLGFARRPARGTPIRFNVGRNTLSEPRGLRVSAFAFVGNEFLNPDRMGVLYIGAPAGLAGDPSDFWFKAEEQKEKDRLARLAREKCVVAQLPVDLDPSIPFLPDELLDPQPVFRLRGAINERVRLPVAIANMTEAFEEYRVKVVRGFESVSADSYAHTTDGLKAADGACIGTDRISVCRGVRFRDSDAKDRGARYDILARIDGASAVPVPAKEAGLAVFEIDCTGLKPGLYKGTLLVTPLTTGTYRGVKYETIGGIERCPVVKDDTKQVPVELEVLPFAIERSDFGYNGYCATRFPAEVDYLNRLGGCCSLVSPWGFNCQYDADGNITNVPPHQWRDDNIRLIRERQKRFGDLPIIMAGYGTYENFKTVHAPENKLKLGTPAYWKAYREYCKFFAGLFEKAGFKPEEWCAEIIDEPDTRILKAPDVRRFTRDEVINAFRIAREAVPKMRIAVTNGEIEFFEDINQYVDLWIFKFYAYTDPKLAGYAKRMVDKGGQVSIYACSESPRQDGNRYYRQLSWMSAAWGAKFVSVWQFSCKPYDAAFRMTTNGSVTYATPWEIVPSVRIMSLEAGLDDIRYLKALERLAAKTSDKALADEARAFIAQSYEEVTKTYAHDPTRVNVFRDGCVRLIARLMAAKGK